MQRKNCFFSVLDLENSFPFLTLFKKKLKKSWADIVLTTYLYYFNTNTANYRKYCLKWQSDFGRDGVSNDHRRNQ